MWRGDYESGDLSQWTKRQAVSTDRLEIVTDPVKQGRYALRASVRSGDDPIDSSGNRNELVYTGDMPQEAERYYRWSTMWPEDYRSPDTWQLFTQWHHYTGGGSPPVEFFTRGETVYLRVDGTDVWTVPLVRGRWHDFVLHVNWSTSSSKGFVELWYDGERALEKTYVATLYPGTGGAYLKQGLYRNESISFEQVLFHDGMIVGTTLEDVVPTAPVEPPPAVEPPAGEPPVAQDPTDPPADDPGNVDDPLVGGGGGEPAPGAPVGTLVRAQGCSQAGVAGLALAGVAVLAVRRRRRRGT